MKARWMLAVLLGFVLAMGAMTVGTWAEITDPENSAGSLNTAGTLDLVPAVSGSGPVGKYTVTTGGNGSNGNVVFSNITPGNSGYEQWTLNNTGNVSASLSVTATVSFAENSATELEAAVTSPHANNGGSDGDLDEFLGVTLQVGRGADQAAAEAAMTYILGDASNYVPMSGLQAAWNADSQSVTSSGGSNDTVVYRLNWQLASPVKAAGVDGKFGTADDVTANSQIVQSDSAAISVTFTLGQ